MKRCELTPETWSSDLAVLSLRSGWDVMIGWQDGNVWLTLAPDWSNVDGSFCQMDIGMPYNTFHVLCEWVLNTAQLKWRDKSKEAYDTCFGDKFDGGWEASASLSMLTESGKRKRVPLLTLKHSVSRVVLCRKDALRIARWYIEDEVTPKRCAA